MVTAAAQIFGSRRTKLKLDQLEQLDITPKTPDIDTTNAQPLDDPTAPTAQDRKRSPSNHCSRDFWTVQSCGQYNDFSWRPKVKSEVNGGRCLIRSWGSDGRRYFLILNGWSSFLTSMVPPKSLRASSRCCFHQFLIVTLMDGRWTLFWPLIFTIGWQKKHHYSLY